MTIVDDIKSRLDILAVVSQSVALLRSGRSYKANCPFHQERTPSFYVFPERQSWRCFGACATGGDLFTFIMRAENLDFAEALKRLAQQAGVALPNRERRSEQQSSYQLNEIAAAYFRKVLSSPQGVEARAYLERRGLSRQSIDAFELGLSPPDGESLKAHMLGLGYSPQQIAQAGLVHRADNGWTRDLFRSRLMIPIRNSQGELGGFGGRSLDGASPKYINSPRTPVFDKGRILYALHLAKEAASRSGIVVVEGYMDAMAAHQHGFTNVVASMGTAITAYQVDAIRRLTGSVTMALDADAAGQQATYGSLKSAWSVLQAQVSGQAQGVTFFRRQEITEIKVAILPEGLDPDEVIQRSPEEWVRLVAGAVPLMDYLLAYLPTLVDISTPQGKARMVEEVFPLIAAVPEPTQQDHYFEALAARLGVTQETLRATIGRPNPVRRGRPSQARPATPSPFAKLDHDPLEEHCLALLLREVAPYEPAEELRPEYFRRLENREIFNQWLRVCRTSGEKPPLTLLRTNIDAELAGHLESLFQKALPPLSQQRHQVAFRDTVSRLEERHLRELKAEEEIKFGNAATESPEEPHTEVLEVNRRIKRNQEMRGSLAPPVSQRGM